MTAAALGSGRYRLGRHLGHGGMATVYLAEDTRLGREVAVKLLAENIAGEREARDRFEREARLAAKLDHPHVVQVFDVGEAEEDGRPFIVMEYVEGGTLDELTVAPRRLPRARALELLRQACDGLGHAHRRGLVHRDVKPQNLLVRKRDGRLKVADFGIARAVEGSALTSTGIVLGTRPYMAPEQLEGGEVGPASDVYALGVVARELLGDRPPPELDAVLRRSLSEEPRRRYADAAELGQALRDPSSAEADGASTRRLTTDRAAGTAETARIESRARSPSRVRRGLPVTASLLAAGAVALGAVAIINGGGSDEGSRPDAQAPGSAEREPAPRLDDPARQGRALADWLRRQAR